ncbi:phage tail protein [Agrococcus sp. DT81.2]|uniref:phage tail protein n=1 Tax=Agrococcus sp. DT81.2 TaxID=3393414 RepID=UPI003CE4DDD5
MADEYLLPAFAFQVTLSRATDRPASRQDANPAVIGGVTAGFAECTGLELEADIKEHLEGGRNDGIIRRVGRVKLSPIVLKRGMFSADPTSRANADLWMWLTRMVSGEFPVTRYNGRIEILARASETPLATWTFDRGLPQKVTGPSLNAKTGEIGIEELHIVHEGLRMEA